MKEWICLIKQSKSKALDVGKSFWNPFKTIQPGNRRGVTLAEWQTAAQ